jgi:predicted SAM-dependent methyltransferase
MNKLILCANERQIKGYKHHDIQPLPGIDYVCDLFDIQEQVKGEQFAEVHFTHALEHFPTKETQKVLALLRDLLVDGGLLYLEVPNFAWHAQILMEGRERDAVYYAFGGQLNEWDFHKTGFTENILREELELAGFKDIKIQNSSSLTVRAKK